MTTNRGDIKIAVDLLNQIDEQDTADRVIDLLEKMGIEVDQAEINFALEHDDKVELQKELANCQKDLLDARTIIDEENKDHIAECNQYKAAAMAASVLVAEMHNAAMGEVIGPKRGVVEDVADLRADRDRLRAALEEVIAHDKYVMHQRCPDCDHMCKGECRDMPISKYGKIAQEALKGARNDQWSK